MLTKSRVAQLLVMLVVLLYLFFWRTFDDQPVEEVLEEPENAAMISLLRCDYDEACEFITEHGTYYLDISNMPLQAEEWIDFGLTIPHENSVLTKAQLVAKTMFMGRIPVKFKQTSELEYIAKGIVGGCALDEMIWELQITIENAGKTDVINFDFLVKK